MDILVFGIRLVELESGTPQKKHSIFNAVQNMNIPQLLRKPTAGTCTAGAFLVEDIFGGYFSLFE